MVPFDFLGYFILNFFFLFFLNPPRKPVTVYVVGHYYHKNVDFFWPHSLLSLSLNDEGCAYSNELISFCLSSHFYASGQKKFLED